MCRTQTKNIFPKRLSHTALWRSSLRMVQMRTDKTYRKRLYNSTRVIGDKLLETSTENFLQQPNTARMNTIQATQDFHEAKQGSKN